jgi:hypothetical protein
MKTKLKIHCASDVDLCGFWTKDETEQEMTELDQKPEGDDWIRWILDHVFADFDVDTKSLKDVLVWSAGRMTIANPADGQMITIELD